MRTKLFLFTFAVAMALVAAGCSKSSSPTSPQTSSAPTFPLVTIKGPNTNSTNTYAQTTKATCASVSALTTPAFLGALITVNPTQSGNTWTWTATEATLSITSTATKQSDGSYTWSATLNGIDPSDSVHYNNWVALTGSSSADGKSGDFKSYNVNATTLEGDFIWSTNASGVLTATLQSYSSNGSTVTGKLVITNNPDNSGELDEYTGTVLVFKSTWVAAGTGSWWTYDSGTGTQTGTGTWS
jgi:hypothetical protein